MKRFFDPCWRHRQGLALLAGGVLPETERGRLENHLAACADCRKHFQDLKAVTAPLANSLARLAPIQPTQAAKDRWADAIQSAASPKTSRPAPITSGLGEWWRDVIRPCRPIWTGLAVVWVLILAGNLSLHDRPHTWAGTTPPPSKEIMMAFKDRQIILAELLADHSAPPEADRPKLFLPKPRTEITKVLSA